MPITSRRRTDAGEFRHGGIDDLMNDDRMISIAHCDNPNHRSSILKSSMISRHARERGADAGHKA
jgi:hypothetical protein